MNDELKEIIELINTKYEDYYIDDFLSGEDVKKLADYITNLQKENQILKENAIHNDKVVDKARWNENIYKSRIDKAISILNKRKEDVENFSWVEMRRNSYYEECDEIINILKGDSNE